MAIAETKKKGVIRMDKPFDLNMEEVLENWEPFHAIREVIANALDEQLISNTDEIEIFEDENGNGWHIRDFGRGIEIEHFTQNENPEKFEGPPGIIGKFGVGMKDALATLHRHEIHPKIMSAHGTYTITMHQKEGFDEIETLHVMFDDNGNDLEGTDFFLEGTTEEQIDAAKDLFLKFNDTQVLEQTKYGSVLESVADDASNRVYINGVLASEEENFLFSYNITNLTKSMRKALNRERTNVGRSTYTERIKSILKSVKSEGVLSELAEQVRQRSTGEQCDEVKWADVAQVGIQALAKLDDKVIYATEEQLLGNPDYLGDIQLDGYTIITVSDSDRQRITGGDAITFDDYVHDFQDTFEFEFVDPDALSSDEKEIFDKTSQILDLVGWSKSERPSVRISETMRRETDTSTGSLVMHDAAGTYSLANGIIILRTKLSSLSDYASILLHEAAHASSGATDATRDFENKLTQYLGRTAEAAIDDE